MCHHRLIMSKAVLDTHFPIVHVEMESRQFLWNQTIILTIFLVICLSTYDELKIPIDTF